MEYSINSIAKLAGVSTRTLRYYDEINLLKPLRTSSSGYRIYGPKEVDKLQQIMFYRQLDVELTKINELINDKSFDALTALESHLAQLENQKAKINSLINTVNLTIKSMKGETTMNDNQKFEAFKDGLIKENEEKYGAEIRKKYSDEVVNKSNEKLKNATETQWKDVQILTEKLNATLKQAVEEGDPAGKTAQEACALHKEYLSFYWNFYTKEAHLGLCEMYTIDDRFKAYYEAIAPGCAEFLFEAMKIYLA